MRAATCLCPVLFLSAAAMAAPPAYHSLVQTGNPLLWYKFNEPAGATQVVNSGSLGVGFNANVPAGVTLGVATASGDTGIAFDGSAGQFLQSLAAAPASLTGDPTFTCETVVKVNANNSPSFGYPPFLHWGSPTTGRAVYFSLHHFESRRPYIGFYNGGLTATCEQPLSRLTHIVWTHQGGGGQWGGSTLYINGRVVATVNDTVLIGAPTINVTSTTFTVNAATDGTRRFSGLMDEVVLYDRVLTADEVAARFAALGLPGCAADVANLGGAAACSSDGSITADDLIVFLAAFFAGNMSVADVASLGGSLQADGQLTADDIIAFLGVFFAGCA